MTLEIYDYLLIRNYLIQENNEQFDLTNEINAKEQFAYFVKGVSEIMQNEDMPLLCNAIQEEISDIIQKYRFIYNSSEIRDDINYIINRLNEYSSMSDKRKNYLINEWYKKECEDRLLPRKYQNYDCINLVVLYDFYNLELLTGMKEATGNELKLDLATSSCKLKASIAYLSTFNLIINRFKERLTDSALLELANNIAALPKYVELSKEDLKYIRKTLKNIEKNLLDQNKKRLFK